MNQQTNQAGYAWTQTERAYRRAVSKAAFSETQLRVLDKIIFFSAGLHRHRAIIPKQSYIATLCGLDEGEVSKALDQLEAWGVIEREAMTMRKKGKWWTYALLTPPWMKVQDRIVEDREFKDLERWLDVIELGQDELLPPDKSFADARREQFVESRVENRVETPSSQVSPDPYEGTGGRTGPPVSFPPVGDSPSRAVGHSPRPVEPVGKSPTPSTRDSSLRDRDSVPGSQSRERVPELESRAGEIEKRARVESYLYETIGRHEKTGRCAVLWENAIREIPDELDELIGHAKMAGVKNLGAWLNRSVYRELERIRAQRREATAAR